MATKRKPDQQRLDELLVQQYDVIARYQAFACGITRSALRHKLRHDGPWRKILPGVYAAHTGTITPEQRDMAALLHAGPGSVITGAAAVRRHNVICAGLGETDVLVRTKVRVQSAAFARIQHTTRMPSATWSTRGIRFAPLPRAVADAARGMKNFKDVQALVCDVVQQGRCTIEELITELRAGPSGGARLFREALGEITSGIRSVAERDLKLIIDKSDVEKPMYNPRLYLFDGESFTFLGIPDAWWQRAGVAAEVDSLQYHLRAKDHADTVARHNRMEAAGIRMLHFQPKNVKPEKRQNLATIRQAIARGLAGPELPIVAVPANEPDDEAYLKALLGSLQPALLAPGLFSARSRPGPATCPIAHSGTSAGMPERAFGAAIAHPNAHLGTRGRARGGEPGRRGHAGARRGGPTGGADAAGRRPGRRAGQRGRVRPPGGI